MNGIRLGVVITFKSRYLRVQLEIKLPPNIANVPANILPLRSALLKTKSFQNICHREIIRHFFGWGWEGDPKFHPL